MASLPRLSIVTLLLLAALASAQEKTSAEGAQGTSATSMPGPESSPAAEFRIAEPGWQFEFPRDHGSHEEFQTEWWYFTGHLEGSAGRKFGFELTFFRVGIEPPSTPRTSSWDLHNLALAHFALTDITGRQFRFHEKLNRQSPFTAGSATGSLNVFNEGWTAMTQPDGSWRIRASTAGDGIDLVLRATKPPAIHGTEGVSVKAATRGAASHYYSMPRLAAEGFVTAKGARIRCRGLVWMDHEYSTSILAPDQAGWDWFSLQLNDGNDLMLYQMRKKDGSIDSSSSGSYIDREGAVRHLAASDFSIRPNGSWRSEKSGGVYPMGWDIRVPSLDLALTVSEVMKDQELITTSSTGVTYWEGAVLTRGRSGPRNIEGQGYVEMTGYAGDFDMNATR
ncbi:MAG TPA: lipocalin-like domain-containing protein [Thermoanaerobaculia bacterium]|nr:lipocalin-like domain-containing protein [Thermoanaerobaculia bacterium]